jgi:hypothetical protein
MGSATRTPYDVLRDSASVRRRSRAELLGVTKSLEDRALADPPELAAVCIQDVRRASPRVRRVWGELAAAGTEVAVHGRDVPAYLAEGVAGFTIDESGPLADVWSLLLVWHDGRAAGFAGTDLGVDFDVAETEDPDLVRECLRELGLFHQSKPSP